MDRAGVVLEEDVEVVVVVGNLITQELLRIVLLGIRRDSPHDTGTRKLRLGRFSLLSVGI